MVVYKSKDAIDKCTIASLDEKKLFLIRKLSILTHMPCKFLDDDMTVYLYQ